MQREIIDVWKSVLKPLTFQGHLATSKWKLVKSARSAQLDGFLAWEHVKIVQSKLVYAAMY